MLETLPAARLLLQRVVPTVLARYQEMAVDIVVEDRLVDIGAEGFDTGVRLGESVPQDMIGVPFGGAARFLPVASPAYLQKAGTLTLDHMVLMIEAAAADLGVAYVLEAAASPWLADGRLVPVLEDWCPSIGGMMLYYPGRRQVPAALRAFIDTLKEPDALRPEALTPLRISPTLPPVNRGGSR